MDSAEILPNPHCHGMEEHPSALVERAKLASSNTSSTGDSNSDPLSLHLSLGFVFVFPNVQFEQSDSSFKVGLHRRVCDRFNSSLHRLVSGGFRFSKQGRAHGGCPRVVEARAPLPTAGAYPRGGTENRRIKRGMVGHPVGACGRH